MIKDHQKPEQDNILAFQGNEFVSAEEKKARAGIKQRLKSRPELATLFVIEGYPAESTVYIMYLILEAVERIEKKLENIGGFK